MTTAKNSTPVQDAAKELDAQTKAIEAMLKKKAYGKAEAALAEFPDGAIKEKFIADIAKAREKAAADKLEKEGQQPAASRAKATTPDHPKLPDNADILKMYDKLIDGLASMEAKQRQVNKPYRMYFVHRKKAEVMRLNFTKSFR